MTGTSQVAASVIADPMRSRASSQAAEPSRPAPPRDHVALMHGASGESAARTCRERGSDLDRRIRDRVTAMLHVVRHGSKTERPALLAVHGLFGSGRNLGILARDLAADREVVVVDMRNHGESFHAAVAHLSGDGRRPRRGDRGGGGAAGRHGALDGRQGGDGAGADAAGAGAAAGGARHRAGRVRAQPDGVDRGDAAGGPRHRRARGGRRRRRWRRRRGWGRSCSRASTCRAAVAGEPRCAGGAHGRVVGLPGGRGDLRGAGAVPVGGAVDYVLPEHRATIRALFPQRAGGADQGRGALAPCGPPPRGGGGGSGVPDREPSAG